MSTTVILVTITRYLISCRKCKNVANHQMILSKSLLLISTLLISAKCKLTIICNFWQSWMTISAFHLLNLFEPWIKCQRVGLERDFRSSLVSLGKKIGSKSPWFFTGKLSGSKFKEKKSDSWPTSLCCRSPEMLEAQGNCCIMWSHSFPLVSHFHLLFPSIS